jgi:hypothetical protein
MPSVLWIIVYLCVPILILPGLFGVFGPQGKRAARLICELFLALIAVGIVLAVVFASFSALTR